MAQSQTNWEADKMLDVYIYDYLVKRDLKASAQAFQVEGKVSSDPVAIDAPGGFLFEWWSVFWDIFIARTNEKHSEVAASYIETQFMKAREQQQQQQQQPPPPPPPPPQQPQQSPQQQQQQQQPTQPQQMQQFLIQRQAQQQQQQQQAQQVQQQQSQQAQQQQSQQAQQQQSQQAQQQQAQHAQQQQQRHEGNIPSSGISGNDPHTRQNPGTANALATKMYEEKLKVPVQRDSLDDVALKQRFGDNMGQLLDQNQASILKSSVSVQQPGQMLHGTSGVMSSHVQARSQQFPGSTQDIKAEMNSLLNPRAAGPEGSLIGILGPNHGGNNLTLNGRPLTGYDQLRPGLLQQPKSFMQGSQPLNQLQMLTLQHQQQLMLAQQNMTSPSSSSDVENRKLRMLYNSNRSLSMGKDGLLTHSIGDAFPLQAGMPIPRGDPEILMKLKLAQLQHHQQQSNNQAQQQLLQQHVLSGQQPLSSNHNLQSDNKIIGASSIVGDVGLSNSFRSIDQASKNQTGRKRKQPVSSSGPANSSGTGNTAGPSPSSAPSTPSTHTPGDMSMPVLPHIGNSSKALVIFGADNTGTLTSSQLWGEKDLVHADIDRFVDDVEDNVESFLSHDDADTHNAVGRCMDVSKGFSFTEVNSVCASANKVICCHFSSDGKLLATGGHDKKAILWYSDTLKQKTQLEEHSNLITDVRFSPSMARLATSSFDKTVRVWDTDNPGYSLRTFTGHSSGVMSLDFHPNKEDLICSCDGDGEIRYWSINNGSCARVFKGANAQVRFQPRSGRYLAAAAENVVSILDAETQACRHSLKGHTKPIHSLCWDPTGELLASASEDSVKVWTLRSGSEGECLHELSCNGNKFHSCVFHPTYSSLLVIGCYQSLELWNMMEDTTMTLPAHEGLIASLAVSTVVGLVASASHDKIVKLWK